jgi:hypothetical protein
MRDRKNVAQRIADVMGAPLKRVELIVLSLTEEQYTEIMDTIASGPLGEHGALAALFALDFARKVK